MDRHVSMILTFCDPTETELGPSNPRVTFLGPRARVEALEERVKWAEHLVQESKDEWVQLLATQNAMTVKHSEEMFAMQNSMALKHSEEKEQLGAMITILKSNLKELEKPWYHRC